LFGQIHPYREDIYRFLDPTSASTLDPCRNRPSFLNSYHVDELICLLYYKYQCNKDKKVAHFSQKKFAFLKSSIDKSENVPYI